MADDDSILTGIVRADGLGELRGAGVLERLVGGSADEVRALVIQRAMAISTARGGAELQLRVVDLDAIYPLAVNGRGDLREVAAPLELAEGDAELTPDEDIVAQRIKSAARDEGDRHAGYDTDLHPALRLPRPDMMSRQPDPPAGAAPAAFASLAPDEGDDEPEDVVDVVDELDEDESLDDFHDEALDDEFDDEDDDADAPAARAAEGASPRLISAPPAAAPATAPASSPATALAADGGAAADGEPAAGEPDDWAPSFPRAPRRAQREPASPVAAAPLGSIPSPRERAAELAAAEVPAARPSRLAEGAPTVDDFLSDRHAAAELPAGRGWRASLRRGTGGLVSLGPGARERRERDEVAAIQRTFDGSKTIVVVNPKGGAHKTTATLMIAATFGMLRGGYTLAWDNNETRGTLGWRSKPGATRNTAVDLLRQLPHFEISGGATIGDIDRFVRNQGEAKFDVLASDDDAASAAIIDDEAFSRLHRTLSRFYRVLVVDTGNNMRASNWEAALEVADQLVIVSTHREDTAASAAWLADGLRERGHEDLLRNAVTILSSPSEKEDRELTRRLVEHFAQLTRAVVEVPYDHEFVGGGQLDVMRLQPATRDAWRHAVAVIAEGL